MDFSNILDVNPDEIIRMVEDMDDLDNDLFGSSKKQKSAVIETKEFMAQSSSNVKKKVTFHDYDEDDPLADLLSEEDFQEKPKLNSIKSKSSVMSDLFGIQSANPSVSNLKSNIKSAESTPISQKTEGTNSKIVSRNDDWLGLIDEPSINIQEEQTVSRVRNVLDNNEDDVTKLIDKSNSMDGRTKKSLVMEDLFGNRPRSTPLKEFNVHVDSEKHVEKPFVQPKMEQSKTQQSAKSLGTEYVPTTFVPREPRRGRRSSGVSNDPLGLLGSLSSSQSVEVSRITQEDGRFTSDTRLKSTFKEDLPEWLDDPKKPKEENSEVKKQNFSPSTKLGEELLTAGASISSANVSVTREIESIEQSASVPQTNMEHTLNYPEHVSTLIGAQFDQQAAIMSMQQQEHELRTATTLSRQNEQLSHLLENQRVRLSDQEKQFNLLIKRQIDRQALLESQMKMQQERIDHYIQALMAQPTFVPSVSTNKNWNEATDEQIEKEVDSKNLVQKLQTDNHYLENILDNLKEKHEKEIMILEESYKKQITFLQEAMEKLEKRMYCDIERIEADYEAKIQKLKNERTNVEIVYMEEIENLKKEHAQSLEEIHDRQRHNIMLLQKEHAEIIESISKAKEVERQAVEIMTTHSTDLASMLQGAQVAIDGIQNLQKRVENKNDEAEEIKLNYLKKEQENIELLKEYLKRQEDAVTIERKQLNEATRKLEESTLRLILESQKRNDQNNEVEERLKMREKSLIRDRELFNGQIEWEHSYLQMMREAWIKEQERQTRQLVEEREFVTAEKAKLEVLNRLKVGADNTVKVELEAALKAAQDATNNINEERHKWRKKLNEVELQQQLLREKENQLVLRAKELENLTRSTLEKREEGFRALREARHIENQHKERLGQLQMQLESLAQRENKIATEKVALARERLSLRMNQAEKPEKDTEKFGTLYNHANNSSHCESQISSSLRATAHFKDIVDPELVLLKLNLDNKLDTTDECLAAMHMTND